MGRVMTQEERVLEVLADYCFETLFDGPGCRAVRCYNPIRPASDYLIVRQHGTEVCSCEDFIRRQQGTCKHCVALAETELADREFGEVEEDNSDPFSGEYAFPRDMETEWLAEASHCETPPAREIEQWAAEKGAAIVMASINEPNDMLQRHAAILLSPPRKSGTEPGRKSGVDASNWAG